MVRMSPWYSVSPVLVLVVILFLSHTRNDGNDVMGFVSAAPLKEKPPFSEKVARAAGCSVCYHLVMNAAIQIQSFLDATNRSTISPNDAELLMEHICDPYNMGGAWIRRIGFFVLRDNETDENSPVHFESLVLKRYSECKRTCTTVKDICDEMYNFVAFDTFSKEIGALTAQSNLLMDENAVNLLRIKFCQHFTVCDKRDAEVGALNQLLNEPDSKDRDELLAEKIEWMDPDRLHIEFSIYKSQNKVEVFTRQDIEDLKTALAMNDYEGAALIDEKIRELTTQEFLELRKLAMEERVEMATRMQQEQVAQMIQEKEKKEKEDVEKLDNAIKKAQEQENDLEDL